MNRLFTRGVFPWIAAGTAFLLYALTRVPGYMPGASAFALTQALPDSDFPTFGFTLWFTLVELLDRLPFSLATSSSWLAALTGALTIWGLVRIAMDLSLGDTAEEQRTPVPEKWLRVAAVSGTLLVSLWTLPLWFAHTRPFPQGFGLMLITLAGAWTLDTFRQRSPGMLNVSALLWGWMVTETASAWFFLPCFAGAVLMTGFDVSGQFRWGRNLRLFFLFLAGALVGYFWMSLRVLHHPHAPLQNIESLGQAFLDSLRVQRSQMQAAAPDRGSLLVLLMFGGPFFVAVAPKRQATLDIRIGSILLHTACVVINGFMLFHPSFSPWGLYQAGQLPDLMVVPYAMLAVSSGYLAAYWVAVLFKYDPYQPLYLRIPRFLLRLLVIPVLVCALAASTVWKVLNWKDPYVAEVNEQAKALAKELEGTDLYWGNPGFPFVLRLTLRDLDLPVRVLNPDPVLWSGHAYRNIMAESFSDSPRFSSMAEIGLYPLFTALAEDLPDFEDRFLLGDRPDQLVRLGKSAVPVSFGYAGHSADAQPALAPDAMFASWEAMRLDGFWEHMRTETQIRRSGRFLLPFLAMESRRANNLGVMLEDMDREEEAIKAYLVSRELFPGNVSALLNVSVHLEQLTGETREQVETEFTQLKDAVGNARFDFWRLSSHYGYVRDAEFHVQRGLGWAVTGKPNIAIQEFQRAIEENPASGMLRLGLAEALAAGEQKEEAEVEYLRVLQEDPDSAVALMGLIRLHITRGQLPEARSYLEQLRQTDIDVEMVYREDVQLTLLEGNLEGVRTLAEEWHRQRPNRLTPVLLMIGLAVSDQDEVAREKWLAESSNLKPANDQERIFYARILFLLGRGPQARGVLQPLLSGGPRMVEAQAMLLKEAVVNRDRKAARARVREILKVDPAHADANYVLGTLHVADGRQAAAESAFRTSLKARTTATVLNDLAYLLLQKGELEEALTLSGQATELRQQDPNNWDTLASILLALNRPEEAYQAQTQALSLQPRNPVFRLTMARILSGLGRAEEVATLVDELFRDMEAFSAAQRQQLRELAGQR